VVFGAVIGSILKSFAPMD
jgi:hypothetical protein